MRSVLVLLLSVALLAGCSGSSGVEVSHDWGGVRAYVVADVGGLVTVVGLDPSESEARSLAVLPGRDDDDPVTGPVLARQRKGESLLIRPATGARDPLYRITRGDEALTRIGVLPRSTRLYPWSGGWVEVVQQGRGASVRALDRDLSEVFALRLPVRTAIGAGWRRSPEPTWGRPAT